MPTPVSLYAYSNEGPDRRLKRGHNPNESYVTFDKTSSMFEQLTILVLFAYL